MHVKSAFCRLSITSITPSITAAYRMDKGLVIDVTDVIDVFNSLEFYFSRNRREQY